MISLIFALHFYAHSAPAQKADTKLDLRPEICESVLLEIPNIMGETETTKNLNICHDAQFRTVMSQDCKGDKCPLIQLAKTETDGLSYSPRGTPGSWLCKKLGGKAEMVFMKPVGSAKETIAVPHIKVHICQKQDQMVSVDYLLSKMPASR